MSDLIRVGSTIASMMAPLAIDYVKHRERFVSIVQKVGFDPNPPQDFEGCYVHTLVEYGLDATERYGERRSQPLIEFFGHEDIRQAFAEWFKDPTQERATFDKAAEELTYWNRIGDDLRDVDCDPRQEFEVFADMFNKHVDRTRSAGDMRQDRQLAATAKMVEEIHKQIVPAESSEGLLARELRAWFEAQDYTVEREFTLGKDSFEWIINIPTRRGFQRIFVRGVEGVAEMKDLIALRERVEQRGTDEGWLIAPRRVAQSVRQTVKERAYRRLFCYTFDEFLDEEVDFDNYIQWLAQEVKSQAIEGLYVPLACTKQEYDAQGKPQYKSEYDNIDQYIGQWLDDPAKEHISILGEFGTGKTWFTLHYAWHLLQDYRQAKKEGRKRPRLPLLIPLRDYAKEINVDSLFLNFVFRKHQIKLRSYAAFEQLNRMGKLLLIFDGFDEMADRIDRQKMINNFWELGRSVVPGAKVILTSRTEHFPHRQESRALLKAELRTSTESLTGEAPQFEILHLNNFTNEQIRQVLTLHATTPETVTKILEHPELQDLARRPVMINLILQALPEIEAGKAVDLARVYLYAVQQQLDKINTGRSFTSTADKLYFLCELSWEMLSTNQMTLNYRDFPDRLRQLFGLQQQKDLDHWAYDMRGQTMLIRNEDGDYKPAHRSLLEFFVAYKFAAEMGALTDDFLPLARSQSPLDTSKPAQNYTWSQYFQHRRDARGEVVPIPPLGNFAPEQTEQLKETAEKQTIPVAAIDFMRSMLDKSAFEKQKQIIAIICRKVYVCENCLVTYNIHECYTYEDKAKVVYYCNTCDNYFSKLYNYSYNKMR